MTNQEAYELGVKLALEDVGLVRKSAEDVMHPIVQKGIQQRRLGATAGGDQYAKNWSKNVPRTPTEKAYDAPSMTAGPPKLKPIDYSEEAGKKFKGVGGKPGLKPLGHNRPGN